MENILTFELINGVFNPLMAIMFFAAAFIGVDIVELHYNIRATKAQVALLFALPVAAIYVLSGSNWETVLATYAITVAAYDVILKHIKNKLT